MSEVKRYNHEGDYCGPQCGHVEAADGGWVSAEDYASLEAECERLRLKVAVFNEGKPYAALKAERDALRAELAALKAPAVAGDETLADRMRAAGMLTVDEMLSGAPLDRFIRHAGVNDLDTYGQWLEMKCREFLTMQASRELEKREDDDLYEWVLAHAAAFQEARINFNAARPAQTEQPQVMSEEAASTLRGMIDYCLNQRVCMGMDEGFKSFDPEEEHDFVKELRAFAESTAPIAQTPAGPNYKFKFEALVEHAKRQDKVIADMRYDENIRRYYDTGEVWFWAGDGTDNLDTLACPVVINAGDLRALIAGRPADGLVEALETLLGYAERQVCTHEETHRGGAIWEICDMCGAKWADDEGGKPDFEWPAEIEEARAALAAHRVGGKSE